MNDEFVDIFDEYGSPTGEVKLKSEAHTKGLFHSTAHIWFYTSEGNILFQQRSFSKKSFPGLWDVSVAGHVSAGEKIIVSAVREIKEEIGLDVSKSDLKKIGIHKCIQNHTENFIDCEFHHIFISKLNCSIESLTLQETEVNDVKLISIKNFEAVLENESSSKDYVVLDNEYYSIILNAIKKELN